MNIWNKFIELLSKIGQDKFYHFVAGLLIAAFFGITLKMGALGVVASIAAAFIKEFIDEKRYGGFDWKDLVWTCGGGLCITICFVLKILIW